jgi:hypothetical protein
MQGLECVYNVITIKSTGIDLGLYILWAARIHRYN